jgi:hypothetical protein
MLKTVELQREALGTPLEKCFIHESPNVKGPYTSGDYIRWKLNAVFGPDNWSHSIIMGPQLINLNEKSAYVQATVRLSVTFADGKTSIHDDVGVWPFQATSGKDLPDTAPERYETVLKATITDGLKACTEYLGICFRPLADKAVETEIRKRSNGGIKPDAPAPPAPPPKPAVNTPDWMTDADAKALDQFTGNGRRKFTPAHIETINTTIGMKKISPESLNAELKAQFGICKLEDMPDDLFTRVCTVIAHLAQKLE